MTDQICSSPARICSSLRSTSSFCSITQLIDRPVARVWASSSAPVRNGYGTGVVSATTAGRPASSSPRTNPPPTEKYVRTSSDEPSAASANSRMPLVWKSRRLRRCSTMSVSGSKSSTVPDGNRSDRLS
jgi:hypothetical protein